MDRTRSEEPKSPVFAPRDRRIPQSGNREISPSREAGYPTATIQDAPIALQASGL